MKNAYGFIVLLFAFASCASYKQSLMFKTDETTTLKQKAETLDRTYVLANFDGVSIEVFTKNGERLVDPDKVLMMTGPNGQRIAQDEDDEEEVYVIDENGVAKLPMVGEQKIAGLTLREAELFLQKEFSKYYENVFVTLKCTTRRVIVLGVPGGMVLPLTYEHVSVVEVVAMSKGFMTEGKAQAIRLVRGDDVYVIDLSTVEGYRKGNMTVLPGDIIYMEPVIRPFVEALGDYGQLVSISISLLTLLLVVAQ